jgi:TDG/mug DNA glycosylase family protein
VDGPLPDLLRPGLEVVFVGINPGLVSARRGHYFANPRNPFWRLLHETGLTPRLLDPTEDRLMPDFGYGLTDVVKRPSRGAADLAAAEFRAGRPLLERKLLSAAPRVVCFNGRAAFDGYFGPGRFRGFGPQSVTIGPARVYVVPSTSPANFAFSLEAKRRFFEGLKAWLEELRGPGT